MDKHLRCISNTEIGCHIVWTEFQWPIIYHKLDCVPCLSHEIVVEEKNGEIREFVNIWDSMRYCHRSKIIVVIITVVVILVVTQK